MINKVYAFDASTSALNSIKLKWTFPTGGAVVSSPAVSDGVVYVGSLDNNVYAIYAINSTQKWNFTTGNLVESSPAVSGGVVYVGSDDNNVYALNASTSGLNPVKPIWKFPTGNAVVSSPAVSDGVVYVGSDDNKMYALDTNDTQKWNFTTKSYVESSPAVSGGVVYVGSGDVAYVGSGDVAYVGSLDNNVYALDNGTQKWKYTTGNSVLSSPAVSGGVVYAGSYDGNVYAFYEPILTTIEVSPTTASASIGSTQLFTALPIDQFVNTMNTTVVWNSSNTTVGTIDSNGLFIAKASGTTTVTAASGTVSGNASVTVNPQPVLTVSATPATVTVGTPTPVTFSVKSGGAEVSGATVTLTGSATGTGTTDSSGNAVISVNASTSGTITATANETGYTNGTANMISATPMPTPAPNITGFAPASSVNDTVGASRTFNISVNQTVNVTWYINGTEVLNQTGVNESAYTNTSAAQGIWNISAVASNANGNDIKTWIWNIPQSIVSGAPNIISFIPPPSTLYDIDGATRTFSITVNQIVDVTWYINGTLVQPNTSVSTANYTNTSAAAGFWNVTAIAVDNNGTASQTWIWSVTAPTPTQNGNGKGSSSGGGGGGGGGGASCEDFKNIEVKEKYDLFIFKDETTQYRFTNSSNPVMFVNITGNTNAGEINTMVEVLKNTSTCLKNNSAPGIVYKNFNIWVGTSGFGTSKNIQAGVIGFRIENSWLDTKGISDSDIKLVKWDGSKWIEHDTKEKNKDASFDYFEAETTSFSPFAITSMQSLQSPPPVQNGITPAVTAAVTTTATLHPKQAPKGPMNLWTILSVLAIMMFIIGIILLLRRSPKPIPVESTRENKPITKIVASKQDINYYKTAGTVLKKGKYNYKIVKLLKSGGMGFVYEGKYDGKKCVIKEPKPGEDIKQSNYFLEKLKIEAEVLRKVKHDNIVGYIDSFEEGQSFFLVEEYVEGENLGDKYDNNPGCEDEVISQTLQLLSAVQYLHKNQIKHRDIKPNNLIFTPDKKLVLIDFGTAKYFNIERKETRGVPETMIWTPYYAPPEQQWKGNTSEVSDIFSIGRTMYFMLTGKNPTDSKLDFTGKNVTKELADFAIKAAEPEIKDRYESVDQMINLLNIIKDDVGKTDTNTRVIK